MAITRSEARKVSAAAQKAGATVLGGQLRREDGSLIINQTNVSALLAALEGQNVVLVLSAVGADPVETQVRTCRTCGTDYSGKECPRCARIRSRLRG